MKYVYHSSRTQGLKVIEPRVSYHGKPWVYAMEKPEYCAVFLGEHGNLINQIGFREGLPYIAERFEGALEYSYKNKTGSIYTLDGSDFKTEMTSFGREIVCDHSCEVINEEKIENSLEKILQLEAEGKIEIYRYPNLPRGLPPDKSDLIEDVVRLAKRPGSKILEDVKELHPDILNKVLEKLGK